MLGTFIKLCSFIYSCLAMGEEFHSKYSALIIGRNMRFIIYRKHALVLIPLLIAMLIDTAFVNASSTRYDRTSRKLAFFTSATDDRHNPNVNPRNTTNPPGLPQFTSRPSARPTAKPSPKPTAKPSARPSAKPTAKPSKRPSLGPTAAPTRKPSTKPTSIPTSKPTAKPTSRPTSIPTGQPSRKPTSRPTSRPTSIPTGQPSRKPTSLPTVRPTGRPSANPSLRPTGKPTVQSSKRPTSRPTAKPTPTPSAKHTYRPTAMPTIHPSASPTFRPTTRPTAAPTLSPTINLCARNHYGSFGNTSSSNYILVPYNYEMVTNITAASNQNKTTTDIVRSVEYAITDLLLKSLFSDCASYYEKNKKRWLAMQRQLTPGQVDGISAQPDDILTGDACDVSSILPSNSNIISPISLSCSILQGRLTLYADDTLMTDSLGLEALFSMAQNLIRDGMNSGELALVNDAIVVLRYRDDSEKILLPILAVVSPANGSNNIVQWSLIGLAVLAVLLALLAAARRFKRKKKETKVFHILDDDKARTDNIYDFDGLADFSMTLPSNESTSPLVDKHTEAPQHKTRTNIPPAFFIPESYPRTQDQHATSFDIEGIDDFMDYRFLNHDDLSLDDITPLCSKAEVINLKSIERANGGISALNENDERDYTYEAMGKNRGIIPKCSICFKNADGWMKRCQCRNSSCDKIAHASCIYGKNPSPSISYPGTPPPMLPPILCGSENRGLRRSRSYDEESSAVSGLSKSRSFDESTNAHDKLNEGMMGCLNCR